ncbi:MAG TPA: DUF5317 domain-containing protein [Actinomycetota bacterium]|nr:DUF5317 domain-containing protein [Actinomycetota bacterium]
MKLFALVIILSMLLGLAFGGRFSRLETLRLHWWGLALLGLGIQFVPLPEGAAGTDLLVRSSVLAVSYTLLVTFAAANLRVRGMALILLGLAMNFAVIVANGGMPVKAQTLIDSGQEDVLASLEAERADKHHLLNETDVLTPLADVIAVPKPIGQAISIGDVFIYVGLIWTIVAAMRGRTPSPRSAGWGPYRGRHRPGETQVTMSPPEALPPDPDLGFLPAATRSGSAP